MMRSLIGSGRERLLGLAASPTHSHAMRWVMRFGGMGLFAVSALDASIIPLPIPGSADLLLLALVVRGGNPWLLAFAASSGSILGGYLTWRTGAKGGEVALKRHVPARYTARPMRWVKDHGMAAVAGAALLPPPVPLLPVLLGAGALGISRGKFLLSFAAARSSRYAFVAWLGVFYGRRIERFWSRYLADWTTPILWTIVAIFVAGILFSIWKIRRPRGSQQPVPEDGSAKN